jgi:hypothetical protein
MRIFPIWQQTDVAVAAIARPAGVAAMTALVTCELIAVRGKVVAVDAAALRRQTVSKMGACR